MKKIVLISTLLALITLSISCDKQTPVFPERGRPYILEIVSSGNSEKPDLILRIGESENGYTVSVCEPEELRSVSVVYKNGQTTLLSDRTELPVTAETSEGISVVFNALDVVFNEGIPKEGKSYEYGAFRIFFEPVSDKKTIVFTVSDGLSERTFALREMTEIEIERYPVLAGLTAKKDY